MMAQKGATYCALRRPRRWWKGCLLLFASAFCPSQARASLTRIPKEESDPKLLGYSSLGTARDDPSSLATSSLLLPSSSSLAAAARQAPARRLDESHLSEHHEHSGHVHHHQHHHQHNSQPEDGTSTNVSTFAMYLDGFHWSWWTARGTSASNDDSHSFLGLWDIRSRLQLLSSMVLAFLLSLALECVAQQQRRLQLPHGRQRGPTRRYILLLHTSASLLGYLTMLVAMSYSSELFVALLLGHAVGQHCGDCLRSDGGPVTMTAGGGGPMDHHKDKSPPPNEGFVFNLLSRFQPGATTWRGLFAIPAARERARRLAQLSSSSSHHERLELVLLSVDGSNNLVRDDESESTTRDNYDDDINADLLLFPVRRKRDRRTS